MKTSETRRRFRELLEGDECVLAASAFDPISIRIAEDFGARAVLIGGSIVSVAVLGAPDVTVVTLTEVAEQLRRICRAADVPVFIDADHGFGNALNVKRTVEELDAAGVAGLSIEDTLLPTQFAEEKSGFIPLEEGVGKMRAALEGRDDSALVIAGRTGAVSRLGLDEGIARLKAYEATGVDALFVAGPLTREWLEAVAAETRLPIITGGAMPEDMRDRAYLAKHHVRLWSRGHFPLRAAIQGMYNCMRELHDGVAPAKLTGLASAELMNRVMRSADYDRMGRDFLKIAPGKKRD